MQGGYQMLQRYDIARDNQTNRLSIKEFDVLEIKSHRCNSYQPIQKDYSLIPLVDFLDKPLRQNKLGAEFGDLLEYDVFVSVPFLNIKNALAPMTVERFDHHLAARFIKEIREHRHVFGH